MNTKTLALKARMKSAGGLSLRLQGRCMEPLLKTGDMARIIPTMEVKAGRIYLFELFNNDIALHRAIAVCGNDVMAKGDCAGMYEVLPKENIIGMLVAVKFDECDFWHEVDRHRASRMISTVLSKRLVYDRRLGSENRCHKIVRLACKKILTVCSWHMRKCW